jgi:hypothetical protein
MVEALEELGFQTQQGWRTEERAVIVNHGPAVMRQVTVRLVDENGEDFSAGARFWPPMPIPELHVGQTLHLPLIIAAAQAQIRTAVLSWRDGRVRPQQRTFWVTRHRVT